MKLAYIDPNPLPDQRTVPLQILQNVDAMAENGVDVRLFSPRGPVDPQEILNRPLNDGVFHYVIPNLKSKWWYISGSNRYFYRAAVEWLEDMQPDVIFVRNLKLAYHLLNRTSLPIFFEVHEIFQKSFAESHPMTWRNKRKLARLAIMEDFVYAHVKGLIVKTQTMADDLKDLYGFTTPTLISPNGYDHHQTTSPQEMPNSGEKRIILYLGTLHPWKGLDTLLQALPHIHSKGEVWIAGGKPNEVEDLRGKIASLGMEDRVKLLGAVPAKERFDVIHQADICVHPLTNISMASRYTSPLKLFEYMAMGKAIVTADVPALREVLRNEHNALLTAPGNPTDLADAINRLMNDQKLTDALGKNAYEEALNYTWVARTKHILDFIQERLV